MSRNGSRFCSECGDASAATSHSGFLAVATADILERICESEVLNKSTTREAAEAADAFFDARERLIRLVDNDSSMEPAAIDYNGLEMVRTYLNRCALP